MTQWDILRYDVRVRKRMLRAQHLTETQLERHLQQLSDLETNADTVLATQPGLGQKGGRDAAAAARTPTLQRGGAEAPKEAWPQQPAPSTSAESPWPLPSGTGFSGLHTPAGAAPARTPIAPAPEGAPGAAIAASDATSSNADSTATGPGDAEPTGAQQPPGSNEGPS